MCLRVGSSGNRCLNFADPFGLCPDSLRQRQDQTDCANWNMNQAADAKKLYEQHNRLETGARNTAAGGRDLGIECGRCSTSQIRLVWTVGIALAGEYRVRRCRAAHFNCLRDRGASLLSAPTPTDEQEIVLLATDLSGGGRRDIVTLVTDEGGFIPRVFRWTFAGYREVGLRKAYRLRHEPE